MLSKEGGIKYHFFENLVWLNLGLNPSLPGHWQTLYQLGQWAHFLSLLEPVVIIDLSCSVSHNRMDDCAHWSCSKNFPTTISSNALPASKFLGWMFNFNYINNKRNSAPFRWISKYVDFFCFSRALDIFSLCHFLWKWFDLKITGEHYLLFNISKRGHEGKKRGLMIKKMGEVVFRKFKHLNNIIIDACMCPTYFSQILSKRIWLDSLNLFKLTI